MLKSKRKSERSNRVTSPSLNANRGAQFCEPWQCGPLLAHAVTQTRTLPNGNAMTQTRVPDAFPAWRYQCGGLR